MSRFDWRTEDEGRLEPGSSPGEAPAFSRRRRVLLLFVVLLLFGAGLAYWSYTTAQEHVAETTARVEADVRASHDLVAEAARRSDLELFRRFISSADEEWTEAQEQIVATGSWLDRSVLGLEWQPTVSPSTTITLSADLQEAYVFSREGYERVGRDGEREQIGLRQTRLYRLGPDRWLYAPPRPDFWGQVGVADRSRVRLSYPGRDEALAHRLTADLDDLVERTCIELQDVHCPASFRIDVGLTGDPDLLLVERPGSLPLWARRPLMLPTPTLVGLPLDEAGYEALFQGYAVHVVATVVADHVGWTCCRQGLFFQALLDRQLEQLGLPALVASDPNVGQLLSQGRLDPYEFSHLWEQAPVAAPQRRRGSSLASASAVVDFLLQRAPDTAPATLQRQLGWADSYEAWLARIAGDTSETELALNWNSYLRVQAHGQPPVPQEDVLLLCDDVGETRTLLRFDPQSEALAPELSGRRLDASGTSTTIQSTPDGGALIAEHRTSFAGDPARLRLLLWNRGQVQLLWDSGRLQRDRYQFVDSSPDGRYLLIEEHNPERRLSTFLVADAERCLDDGCNWQRTVYRPYWSPDSRFVINTMPAGNLLFLAEAELLVQPFWYLDYGDSPFWLDEETFGYVQYSSGGELDAVVSASVLEREAQPLISRSQILSLLPAGVFIAPSAELRPYPADPNLVFLAVQGVRSPDPAPTYIFVLARDRQQLSLLMTVPDGDPASLTISPTGCWLTLTADGELLVADLMRSEFSRHPLPSGASRPVWSPGGDWLFVAGEDSFLRLAPAQNQPQLTRHVDLSCGSPIWVETSPLEG
jgi:hypothetical protein